VALSTVRTAAEILEARGMIQDHGSGVPLIAKIETAEALTHIDEIVECADGVMVARGDLGVAIPLATVPRRPKMLIAKANRAGKPVITATHMLRSMQEHPRPPRAEATDVANAVLDGTDAVMLSEETAIGRFPVEAHMLLHANRILARFKGRFLGKSSPVHFFWGAFDLALTRFSGRRAPESKESEWWVLREAMSHEEISFGFWPGSGTVAEPAFYAYARPEPSGLPARPVRPPSAYYSRELADFILPYEAVRSLASPDEVVLDFFQSVYDAAADLARWDRAALDRPPAEWP
jgi:hypothetical protein